MLLLAVRGVQEARARGRPRRPGGSVGVEGEAGIFFRSGFASPPFFSHLAYPERKQTASEKNTLPLLKDGNRRVMITGRCLDGKGRDKPTCGEKQKKQNTQAATCQPGESKTGLNSIRCNNVRHVLTTKGKTVEKSQRVARTAPSTRTTKITSGFTAASQVGKEGKTSVKTSRLQAAAA